MGLAIVLISDNNNRIITLIRDFNAVLLNGTAHIFLQSAGDNIKYDENTFNSYIKYFQKP